VQRVNQLSFDIFPNGTPRQDSDGEPIRPWGITLALSGKVDRDSWEAESAGGLPELSQGEQVEVRIVTMDGELIASAPAKVNVGFKEKQDKDFGLVTIREQRIKLG
jgi:hypothetical protein